MAIEVFNRYEKKYLIDAKDFKWLLEKLKGQIGRAHV